MNEKINLSKNEKTIIVIENDKLILKSLDGFERKNIHKLCDKMGLHHLSVVHPKKSSKKFLHIIKPSVWKWEFSEPIKSKNIYIFTFYSLEKINYLSFLTESLFRIT